VSGNDDEEAEVEVVEVEAVKMDGAVVCIVSSVARPPLSNNECRSQAVHTLSITLRQYTLYP
jgi:hypothetical protein